jgi:hypothetical protein
LKTPPEKRKKSVKNAPCACISDVSPTRPKTALAKAHHQEGVHFLADFSLISPAWLETQ